MNITFIGDIMLGRLVSHKYRNEPYQLVSSEIIEDVKDSFVVANLESPLMTDATVVKDHMCFSGEPQILEQLGWIDMFSTANNHINDFGDAGIASTINELEKRGFKHNGIYTDEYAPVVLEQEKIAIITLTDMMNHELDDNSCYHLLRMDSPETPHIIERFSKKGYFVIVFAHVGMLFTRYPNPITFDYLHQYVDAGAKLIVTAHSHCLGGIEYYKGTPIVHSLGDFLMDGASYRRRRAAYLIVKIENKEIKEISLHPVETQISLTVEYPEDKTKQRLLKSADSVSDNIRKHAGNYSSFYKRQYNREMIQHSLSTITFLYKTKGIKGFVKVIFSRIDEVFSMMRWSVTDRSQVQSDTDALNVKNYISEKDYIELG